MEMKKIMIICFVLSLWGCTQTDIEKENQQLKVDETKPYVYSVSTYQVPLSDNQKVVVDEGDDVIETVVVNIQGEDAKRISEQLQKQAETQQKEVKKEHVHRVQSFTSLRAEAIESDAYVTILVTTHPFLAESAKVTANYKAYIFQKVDGSLITQEALLEKMNVSDQDVLDRIKDSYEKESVQICGDMQQGEECYYEPEIYRKDAYMVDTVMYLNEQNELVVSVKKNNGMSFQWTFITLAK